MSAKSAIAIGLVGLLACGDTIVIAARVAEQAKPIPAGGQPLPPEVAQQFQKLFLQDLQTKAASVTGKKNAAGAFLDPNGNPLSPNVVNGLILTRDMFVADLESWISQLNGVKSLPLDKKRELVRQWMASYGTNFDTFMPAVLNTEYKKFVMAAANAKDVHGQLKSSYQESMRIADELERLEREQPGTVATRSGMTAKQWRDAANNSPYGWFVQMRHRFYGMLEQNKLLALKRDGKFLFEAIMEMRDGSTLQDYMNLLNNFLDAGKQDAQQQKSTAAADKTIEKLLLYGGPKFSLQHQKAALIGKALGAQLPQLLIGEVTAVFEGINVTTNENEEWWNTLKDLGLNVLAAGSILIPFGPLIAAGVAVIQITRDGSDLVVSYLSEEEARKSAVVTGYQYVVTAEDRTAAAKDKFFITALTSALDLIGLAEIKNIKFAKGATSAADDLAKAVAKLGTTIDAATGGVTPMVSLADRIENGLAVARKLGVPEAEVQTIRKGLASLDPEIKTFFQQPALQFDEFDRFAKQLGLSDGQLQAALLKEGERSLIHFLPHSTGANVSSVTAKDLLIRVANEKGIVFLVSKEKEAGLLKFFEGANLTPGYNIGDPTAVQALSTRLEFVKNGKFGKWTPEEISALNYMLEKPNATSFYAFSVDEGAAFKLFDEVDVALAKVIDNFPKKSELFWGTLPAADAANLLNALEKAVAGEQVFKTLTTQGVGGLSTQQLGLLTPAQFNSLNDATKTAVIQQVTKALDEKQAAALIATWQQNAATSLAVTGGAANLAAGGNAGAKPAAGASNAAVIAPGDYTSMDYSVRQQLTAGGINTNGWTYQPNNTGGFTYTSPDGKTSVDATYSNGKMIVGQPYVTPAKPGAAGAPAPANAGNAANMAAPANAAVIGPADYTSMDYSVREQLTNSGIKTEGWTYTKNNTGGFTYTSPDGKTSVDAVYLNGRMIVGQPYVTPVAPGANTPGTSPGTGAGANTPGPAPSTGKAGGKEVSAADAARAKDLCESAAFWRREAAQAKGYAAKAATPADKARWEDQAKWDEANASRREEYARFITGEPCDPPTETNNGIGGNNGMGGAAAGGAAIDLGGSGATSIGLGGAKPNGKVQLIIITADDGKVTIETKSASNVDPNRDGSRLAGLGRLVTPLKWLASRGPAMRSSRSPGAALDWSAPGLSIELASLQPAPNAQPSVSIVATGASTGDVFNMEVVSPDGRRVSVNAPEGLVMEAVDPGTPSRTPPPSRFSQTARQLIEGYCLEFLKPPPGPGTFYRVAPPDVQKRYSTMRGVLQSATTIAKAGLLHPDSNAKGYLQFIKQYALWTRLENWDLKRFGEHFVDRTRQNLKALGRNWTDEIERQVMASIPGRWADVQRVLQEAAALQGARQ